ncbi:MAG TPA: mannose-6-phosphate isomerase [Firmicutes bacterium]|nr:mannose-6-phosphate isomerase [Bacillota bacterium]
MDVVKLMPAIKDYIWSGTKLAKMGKQSPNGKIAETWELSFLNDGPSIIANGINKGKCLKDVATKEDIGSIPSSFPMFPVLIKLIDAGSNLSVQVHPSDSYALKNENQFGKTEMWHVLEADKGCGLYVGLKQDYTKVDIEKALKEGHILDLLNFFEVKAGDTYFIPSGTIHAIGKGVTLIEIQQSSTLTYRLYDYDRVDKNGKKRELHIEKALKVIDTNKYKKIEFENNCIGSCKYFSSYRNSFNGEEEIENDETSFSSITFLEGEGLVNDIPYKKLDTFFIPANKKAALKGNGIYILTKLVK